MKKRQSSKHGQAPGLRIGDRNRARILEAATHVFALRGFDGARIAEIAERATLPKANVYYYFRTKRAIYETIIKDLVAQWDAALSHLDATRRPAEALADYIRAKLDFSRTRTAQSKMFANEVVHGGRFLARSVRDHMHAITAEKTRVFEAWARAGLMDPIDPVHLFILLWGATQFYADFSVMAKNGLGVKRLTGSHFEDAATTIIQIVMKGCGVRPRVRRRPPRRAADAA